MADKLAKEGLYKDNIQNYAKEYIEFISKRKVKESAVTFWKNGVGYSEKNIVAFVKNILKKSGYKKISIIKINMMIDEGLIESVFDAEDTKNNKIYLNIYTMEEK